MFCFRKNAKRSKWVARILDTIFLPNEVEQEKLKERLLVSSKQMMK
jgi:hypothetical protein